MYVSVSKVDDESTGGVNDTSGKGVGGDVREASAPSKRARCLPAARYHRLGENASGLAVMTKLIPGRRSLPAYFCGKLAKVAYLEGVVGVRGPRRPRMRSLWHPSNRQFDLS